MEKLRVQEEKSLLGLAPGGTSQKSTLSQ